MARKLREANRRLSSAKARFLADSLSRQLPDGEWTWQFSGSMRRSIPTLHSLEEWVACWRGITADKLWIAAADSLPGTVRSNPEAFAFMCEHIGSASLKFLPDTGHNLHHDAPAELARMLESFLTGTR
jgi:pimeloyl-ACP methyl ester carboxylesterase